jgi:hypothetical protein
VTEHIVSGELAPADAEEYSQALGQVVAGSWRQVALGVRLGVPAALGLSTRQWVEERLGGYVRLSIDDRREAAAELTANGHSQREAADILGVAHKTIDRDLDPVSDDTSPPKLPAAEDPSPVSNDTSTASAWDEEAQHASNLHAARTVIQRALGLLTSDVLTPDELASRYTGVLHEFDSAPLDFAAATMAALSRLRKDHDAQTAAF